MMPAEPLLTRAEGFILHETALLRSAQYRAWLELFTADGLYWFPVSPTQTDPRSGPSHVHERRPALDARIERLCDPRMIPQIPASRVSRLLGRPWIVASGHHLDVAVTFQVLEARARPDAEDAMRWFAGEATYRLIPDETGYEKLRIQSKRVDLINSESAFFGVSVLL